VILALVLLGAVIAVVGAPLRAARRREGAAAGPASAPGHAGAEDDQGAGVSRDELEAARESKYREIRDAELDFQTGKLSREDFEAIDRELRADAIGILDALDALDALDEPGEPGEPDEDAAASGWDDQSPSGSDGRSP